MLFIEQIFHGATENCLKIAENGNCELLKKRNALCFKGLCKRTVHFIYVCRPKYCEFSIGNQLPYNFQSCGCVKDDDYFITIDQGGSFLVPRANSDTAFVELLPDRSCYVLSCFCHLTFITFFYTKQRILTLDRKTICLDEAKERVTKCNQKESPSPINRSKTRGLSCFKI